MSELSTEEYDAIIEFLEEVKRKAENHPLGGPFLTTYQIVLHLKHEHPTIFESIDRKSNHRFSDHESIGGVGHGDYHSPTQYLANQLSARVQEQKGTGRIKIEGGFLSGAYVRELSFNDKVEGKSVKASLHNSNTISIFRISKEAQSKDHTVADLQDFMTEIFKIGRKDGDEVFYRGHSKKDEYELEPSLFRKDKNKKPLHLLKEDILYKELIMSNPFDFLSDTYTFDKLIRMQHYTLPTRLLDITSNPLMALYFACKSNEENDGEVISFTMKRDDIKYFDSDTAACIANLSRLPNNDKETIIGYIDEYLLDKKEKYEEDDPKLVGFNKRLEIRKLLHLIREEKSFVRAIIQPKDLRRIICVKGKQNNNRISSQSGAFLLFGLKTILPECGTKDIKITRLAITKENKKIFLEKLDMLNINESTVFPDIEKSAKYITEKYKFK